MPVQEEEAHTQRLLGRLEGRMEGMEARITNLDAVLNRQLNAVGQKLLDISATLETVRQLDVKRDSETAQNKGFVSGSKSVLVFIGAGIVALMSLVLNAIDIVSKLLPTGR